MKSTLKHLGEFFIDILETVVIALSIFVVIYLVALQPHEVKGQSMDGIAGFHDGQYILTDKITYKIRKIMNKEGPHRGEVVVFHYPLDESLDYIKRIIAVPGDSMMIGNNTTTIYTEKNPQGVVLDESTYLDDNVITRGKNFLKEGQKYTLKENEYFVMGDNRSQSSDSRSWGVVHENQIIGRSFFRYWPPNEIDLIQHAKINI